MRKKGRIEKWHFLKENIPGPDPEKEELIIN